MARYHRRVGFPAGTERSLPEFLEGFDVVRYSTHAKKETIRDTHSIIPVVKKVDLLLEQCFEIVTDGRQILKAAFEIPGQQHRYTYVISNDGLVITCWANAKDDSHETLDRRQYLQV